MVSQRFDASQHGTHWHPALCLSGHQHQIWRSAEEHWPTPQPHTASLTLVWLSQSDNSTDAQGHCHHCHFTPEHPQAGDVAAELGSFLCGPEAEDSLQTKDSAVATLSPCHDHWDTHLLVLLFQAWADTEAVPTSSPLLQGRPNPKISLRIMWLFWFSGLPLGCALGRIAECNAQSIHAFTSILYRLME